MRYLIKNIIPCLFLILTFFSCSRDEDTFTVVQENEYYSKETNIKTLLREINPQDEALRFTYKNDQRQPYNQPLDLGAFKDRILYELTPLSFNDRFGEVYRGKVEVSIEYVNKPKDFLRRGFNTQWEDHQLLEFDFALRMIFTDEKGYRLNLREGLEISIISTGTFIAERIFTLKDPDQGWPYLWMDHPLQEALNAKAKKIVDGGNEFIQYDFQMKDNSWLGFGRKSQEIQNQNLCLDVNNSDIEQDTDMDNTMAFALLNTEEVQLVQLHFDESTGTFCTASYPKDQISRIIVCSMNNYVDYYYHESFYQETSGENLSIQHDKVELTTMIERLSSI